MRKKEKHLNMINEMSQLQMCEICTPLHELPWRFRRWMLHVLRPWQKAATLYNQENDHIAIRATYYIFCCRNRNWDSPDLLQCWYLFFPFFLSFFVLLCFVFFFWIIQSQAVFVNYQYVARFTVVHSKTQIKFPLDKTVKTVPTCLQGF